MIVYRFSGELLVQNNFTREILAEMIIDSKLAAVLKQICIEFNFSKLERGRFFALVHLDYLSEQLLVVGI